MARQLIESLSTEFDPYKYQDEYREAVLEMIERKARGPGDRRPGAAEEEPEEVPDLMAALEASIARRQAPGRQPKAEDAKAAREVEVNGASKKSSKPKPKAKSRGQEVGGRPAVEVEVEGRRLRLSNLDKVLYPEVGFTKGQVIDYYTRAAPVAAAPPARAGAHAQALPQRGRRRPLLREAEALARARVGALEPIQAGDRDDRLRGLRRPAHAGVAGQPRRPRAAPVAGAGRATPTRPTVMAFDLDPGPPAALAECCEVALLLRETARPARPRVLRRRPRARRACRSTCRSTPPGRPTTTPSRSRTAWRGCSSAAPEAGRLGDEEGAAHGQGLHRLEPERPPQDHGGRLLPARARAPDGVHAARLGRGRGGGDGADALAFDVRRRCSSGWPSAATCSRRCSSCEQELPDL